MAVSTIAALARRFQPANASRALAGGGTVLAKPCGSWTPGSWGSLRSTPPPYESLPMDPIRVLLSILLPPLGVFLQVGIGSQFWINILLTLLGYFPGLIHAIWIIAKR